MTDDKPNRLWRRLTSGRTRALGLLTVSILGTTVHLAKAETAAGAAASTAPR